jgi:hypothetical protein
MTESQFRLLGYLAMGLALAVDAAERAAAWVRSIIRHGAA